MSGRVAGTVAVAVCCVALAACTTSGTSDAPKVVTVEVILTGLQNPRGVALDAEGGLLVAEAGSGNDPIDSRQRSGRLTRFIDGNGDGDFTDPGEAEPWFEHLASYNARGHLEHRLDEVSGPSDVTLHSDARVFLSIDGGFDEFALLEISPERSMGRNLSARSNMTGLGLTLDERSIFATESMLNQLIEVSLEGGDRRDVVAFSTLNSGQEAVPAGLAVDPRNGDVLVALFSGGTSANDGSFIPFVLGEAKVVRVDPLTGQVVDEIVGLTAAVDVAIDELGNVFVVELAADHGDLFASAADLHDPDAIPQHGGYLRFTGTVTMYPADGGPRRILAGGLDSPTNITVGDDGALYVSTGQGTPGRPIPGPDGPTVIVGEVIRITGF
ncbi:MAG: hypothetical protein O6705_08255 [Actinobacteria bacterium]|nr:hypothetical protein [Actinomycetota bacterium]